MVDFEDGQPLKTEEAVERFQAQHNVRLPKAYIDIVRHHDGATLVQAALEYTDPETSRVDLVECNSLIPFTEEYGWSMNYANGIDWIPDGVIVFGEDAGGIMFGFDYRADPETDNPPIVLVNMENDDEHLAFKVADSFTDFLGMLFEYVPDEPST